MPRILSGPNAVSWDRCVRKSTPLWGLRRASCCGQWSSITRWRRWERVLSLSLHHSAPTIFLGIISNILHLAGFALVRGRHFPAGQPASGPMSVSRWSWSSPARAGAISGHSAAAHPCRPQHYLLPVWGDTHRSAHGQEDADSSVINRHMHLQYMSLILSISFFFSLLLFLCFIKDQIERVFQKQSSVQEMFERRRISLKKLAAKQTRPVQPVAPRPEVKSPLSSPSTRIILIIISKEQIFSEAISHFFPLWCLDPQRKERRYSADHAISKKVWLHIRLNNNIHHFDYPPFWCSINI